MCWDRAARRQTVTSASFTFSYLLIYLYTWRILCKINLHFHVPWHGELVTNFSVYVRCWNICCALLSEVINICTRNHTRDSVGVVAGTCFQFNLALWAVGFAAAKTVAAGVLSMGVCCRRFVVRTVFTPHTPAGIFSVLNAVHVCNVNIRSINS